MICPEHLQPFLASLTLRVCVAARDRGEAERAAAEIFAPLADLPCIERALFVSARPRLARQAPPEVQALALPAGGVRVLRPRVKRLRGEAPE